MINDKLYDWGDGSQNQEKTNRSLFDNLGDAITAIGANFSDVRGSEKLGDIRDSLRQDNLTGEEINQLKQQYYDEYAKREAARQQYAQAHQNLVEDDSFLKNIDQMGGTLEGMAAQGIGTAVGAGLGALATGGAGIGVGAKIGNAAGAVAGGYLDARSVALQAEEEVLDAGGTWEQAKQAYDEALKKASLTTLPETLADIAMGNRLVRAGLSSGVARKIAGSTLGRAGSAVLDPAARVGTKVSRMFNPLAGRAAGWATDVALQGATEAGQEVTQDYIADREVAKALGRQDNEYSLGGFGRYALSDQGLETMKTAGIMGALFGGVGGAVSSGQYLQRGSKYASSNRVHNVAEKMINEGKLSLNKKERQNEEMIISAFKGISPAELSTWSDADIIAQSAEIRGEYLRKTSHKDETQDITGVRGFVDVVNGVGDNQQQKAKTEGELTELANSALTEYGIDQKDRQRFFSTPTESSLSLLEKAKQELQKQKGQEKQQQTEEKQQTKIGLKPETARTMNINNGTVDVQDSSMGEGETTVLDMSQPVQRNTDGVTTEVKYKDNIGEKWQGFTEYTQDGQELEGKAYKNTENGKVARITQGNDGAFYVLDTSEGNTQAQRFETLEQAEGHLIKNQDNKKVFQGSNQSETQEKRTLGKGEVDVDNGATGQHVENIRDLFNFIQSNPDAISPEAFMEFVDMNRRIGTEGVDFYFDTKNKGYVKDDNGIYHEVRGWKKERDESTGRALIQLYRCSDINTAVHEIAHLGYENLTIEEKRIFDEYAVRTMGRFIADLLNINYDQNFRNRLLNLANDEELQNKINEQPAAFQAEIQLFLNGEVDLNNLTIDQQRAIDERWAWEFTFWYMEGYVRGVKPENIIQRLLNRSCIFLGKELEGIRRVWWHIHHKNSGMESMYRDMNGEPMNGDEQIKQQTEQGEQNQPKQIGYRQVPLLQSPPPNFTMGEGTAARYVGNPNFTMEEELPNVNVDNIEDLTNNEVINMARQTKDESPYGYKRKRISEEMTRRSKNLGDERKEVGQYTGGEYNGSRDISTMIDAKVMNDTTAEIFADKLLDTYGNNVGAMRALMVKFYNQAKSDEERRWLTNIAKRALQKYQAAKNGTAYNQNGTYYAGQSQPNNNFGYASTEQPQSSNSEQTTVSPKQLNPAIRQEIVTSPQVEEEFDTNDTIEEENEGEENIVSDAIEEVAENIEQIYKTELEPQEIRSIEGDINEVLDGLENETDKTVKKISQSVGKRIEAAKSALRKSNKETDKGQEVYKLCSMSALKNIFDSRLKDNYYPKGNLNQDQVNNVGNLIKTQLGEIQEEWTKPYSDETESAARRDKAEANRIEKERKEAEKLAKRKQKKQAEVASQNLDILEQQIKNQQGEELTDDQLEEKLENEVAKDNVQPETKKGTKERKFTPEKGLERIRKIAKGSDGIAISKKELETYNKTGKIPEKVRQIREQQNKKKQQTNDIIEGWIDRLSKEEDYNEAMSQLQELLNANAITEDEYNDISKGLEEHFEGEEDTGSKAEQAQEILNKAFPNKVFQYAWHSTPNNFDKFTLEHLLSGEGFMAHGWGLYFAKKLGINKENYFNKFKMREGLTNYDLEYLKGREKDLEHITDIISGVLKDAEKLTIEWDKTWETNNLYLGKTNIGRELMDWFPPYDSGTGNSIFLDENLNKDQLIKILQRQQIKLLEKLIDVRIKIDQFHPKDSTRILLVDIPEDNVLLRENEGFKDQPPKVQRALMKLVRKEGLLNGEENTISNKDLMEHFDEILGVDIYEYNGDIYGTLSWLLEDDPYGLTDEDTTNQGKERCSKLLNKYGIKGISYDGRFDGECAVIFDDTAIDIITKFKQEEGKWKSEKVDNARNREIDKQKAQKKLEKRKKNNDKRFMVHGKSAKGSPLTQEVLDKVEEEYNQKMQEKGISIIQNINMKLRNKAAESGIENVSDKNDPTFNDKYIQIHDEVNEYFWKKYKLFRGLDGEWRFWVSDDGAKLKVSGQDLANGAKFPQTFYSVFKLSEVLSHSKLFKNYPQLKNITVLPVWNRGDGTRGSFTAGEGGGGTIRINLAHPSFYSNETVDEEVIRVLLHEIQHAIQDIEGFAQGGEVSADFLKTKPAMNFILRNRGKLILSLADKLQKGVPSYIMKINGEDQKIDLSFEENPISGEYNPVVTIGGKKIPSIKNKVLSELLISINNIKEDSVKLKESDFDGIVEYLNPKETEYLSKLFKMFNSGNFSLEFENKKLSKEESIQVAKERLSFLHDKKQLGKILEDYEYGSTLNEDFNVAIENSGLSYELYKSLLGEAEARNTAESYKNKYRKGQVPMTLEESYIKAKNGTGQIRINKNQNDSSQNQKRFMKIAKKAKYYKEDGDRRLSDQIERKYENDFLNYAERNGVPKSFIRDNFSNNNQYKSEFIQRDKLKEYNFEQILNDYNKIMNDRYGVTRGLDGRWSIEIDDSKSTINNKYVEQKLLEKVSSGKDYEVSLRLILNHDELYKRYPQFKNHRILFQNNEKINQRFNEKNNKINWNAFSDYENGVIIINADYLLKENPQDREEKLRGTILHEIQHVIQDYEGFAKGGKPQINNRIYSQIAQKLGKGKNGIYQRNVYTDKLFNELKRAVRFTKDQENLIRDNPEKIFNEYINGELEDRRDRGEKLSQKEGDIVFVSGFINSLQNSKDKNIVWALDRLKSLKNAYQMSLGEIQSRRTSEMRNLSLEERKQNINSLDEEMANELKDNDIYVSGASNYGQDYIEQEQKDGWVHDTETSGTKRPSGENRENNITRTQRGNTKGGQGFNKTGNSETGLSNDNNIGKVQSKTISNVEKNEQNNRPTKRRYQKANEKTPLEKAKEQRDARLEQQRKEGITSDFYKDVYSVSFTKSAQQNEENKRKMEYFDKRKEYWDRSEKDGKVTYTRKTPFEHHQKVVTYNGINDVTKEQKKKSKPAQWAEWFKDQLIKYAFNDMHFLAKAARKLGVFDAYTKLVVTKGYALKANTAMERGIKYNGEYTRALNDIIKEVGEEKQHDFIEYCIAKRILDMKELRPEIRQKMSPEEAAELIEKYESGENAELFKKNQKDFVKYNHALLHVLVDGGVMTEEEFQHHIKNDPNFVPLAKVMDDADFGFNGIQAARSIVNVKSPIKKIGTSMREVKNPFLEMQKRTAEYYSIAARNKAGQIFVNEIAGKIDKLANGDTVARGQGMIRKVKIDEKDGKLITKPDEKQQIIYVCNNGKHEFYQVSDPEIYRALRALDADQMGTLHKMIDPFLHAPSALIRETATMVPDFGIRNLIRDGGEAFMTSEHGFLPFIDQIWGMYQMANNTEWYQRFLEQQGEYGTYNRDGANNDVARVEDTIDEKVNPIKNFNEIRRAAFEKFTNKKNSKTTRAAALLQLMGSMPYAIIKSNKRINDYLEMGTRVGEFKNAKMGYNGTLDRLSKGGILDWDANINNAKQSDILAAGVAKEITLNFGQHGIIGKQLNRYIPFFNATLQGIYKMCNALELMATGKTLSGEKNHALQGELLFKAALVTAMAIGVAAAGEGDDDYEEANQYEKENFWILPNGLRFPKDQVLGKLFGNVAEKSYAQWRKGKFEPSDILRSIVENFTPDKFMPAMADITLGGLFNYDTFYKSAIVPEYMQGKLGHLQKDLSTSNMASDISDFLWKYTKTDVSAKRLDWALQKNLTNCKKYIDSLYDLGKQAYDPKSFNEKMARGYDKNDSTGAFVGGLKDDIPKPLSLVTGTFATNRTNYKSISDFYERYNDLKKLATDEQSMSKEEKRAWKRYEQAYKKDMVFRKQLRAIKSDSSLTGKQKRERADKIFKQQIKLAKWAEG